MIFVQPVSRSQQMFLNARDREARSSMLLVLDVYRVRIKTTTQTLWNDSIHFIYSNKSSMFCHKVASVIKF